MSTWAVLIPMAIGLALSPAAIIELILVLFSKRRVVNSIAFVVALLVLSVITMVLGGLGSKAAGETDSHMGAGTAVVFVLFGLLLLGMGIANLRNRHDTSEPKVFAAIGNMGPGPVAFLALGATMVNPKNLPLLLGAGSTIAQTQQPLLYGLGFLVLSTLPYTAAAAYASFGGEGVRARLDSFRGWLIAHNRWVMGIVCLVLGLVMGAKGIGGLLG